MEVVVELECPFCGETQTTTVDTGEASQRYTLDCEVCCRPYEVVVTCEPGSIRSIEVLSG